MSFDAGPVVSTIGNLAAVGVVAKVAQGVSKSVGNSYRSNQRSHKMHKSHSMSGMHKKSSGKKSGYSLWHGTGFL